MPSRVGLDLLCAEGMAESFGQFNCCSETHEKKEQRLTDTEGKPPLLFFRPALSQKSKPKIPPQSATDLTPDLPR
jgi:hypothetical protein